MMTASEFFGQFLGYETLLDICPDIVINIVHPDEYMYGLTSQNKIIAIPMKEIETMFMYYLEHHTIDMSKLHTYYSNVLPNSIINVENIKIGSIIKE